MPYKDPEKLKVYYLKNKEKIRKREKEYNESPAGKKSKRINNWKRRGVIDPDFDELYKYFLNTKNCDNCNCELTEDKKNTPTTRCLDHCHETGEFRNVLCHSCNVKRG
tara:strand:+ start:17 stop:340 length:324 start_codon:yes stop_codon:yes gene_type:complete